MFVFLKNPFWSRRQQGNANIGRKPGTPAEIKNCWSLRLVPAGYESCKGGWQPGRIEVDMNWHSEALFRTQKKEQGHQKWIFLKKTVEDDLERPEHESKFECDDLIWNIWTPGHRWWALWWSNYSAVKWRNTWKRCKRFRFRSINSFQNIINRSIWLAALKGTKEQGLSRLPSWGTKELPPNSCFFCQDMSAEELLPGY